MGDGHDSRTGALTGDALDQLRQLRRRRATGDGASLLLYHRDGVQVVPLVEGHSLVIGRSAPADVAVRDASLSRQHACVELLQGKVWVEDLQSTNGTWLRGTRIERAEVEPGTELSFGVVTASVHGLSPIEGDDHFSHHRFGRELSAEIHRARAHGREATLLMLRAARRGAGGLSRWLPHLRSQLRSFERIALYSPDTVELLLPEIGAEAAQKRARQLVLADEPLVCGLGAFPAHAATDGELVEVTRTALQRASLSDQVCSAPQIGSPQRRAETTAQDGAVVRSPAMEKLYATVERLGSSVIPVLLLGETGTGKEVVARAIHDRGKRAGKPMICVNCAAIPGQLVESTLFGHERGAFTGAERRAEGVFESADGGTVMLDEVGELPAQAQAALLRVLETQRFSRVGSNKELSVDVRVIGATHRDLEAMVAAGEFREDLLYRLNTMTLQIPPLRERTEEIEPLARHFVAQANEANECAVRDIGLDALDRMMRYGWPGNVRELRNAMERAVVIAFGDVIAVDDLPDKVRMLGPSPVQVATVEMTLPDSPDGEVNLRAELARIEAEMIVKALDAARWDRKQAAASLGLPLRTLARKIKDLDIER